MPNGGHILNSPAGYITQIYYSPQGHTANMSDTQPDHNTSEIQATIIGLKTQLAQTILTLRNTFAK